MKSYRGGDTLGKKQNRNVQRAKAASSFQREGLLDVELSDELADDVKHGSQSQGLLASYGSKSARKKSKMGRPDRDY